MSITSYHQTQYKINNISFKNEFKFMEYKLDICVNYKMKITLISTKYTKGSQMLVFPTLISINFINYQNKMMIWNKIMNSFKKKEILTRLNKLCCPTLNMLAKNDIDMLVRELIKLNNKQEVLHQYLIQIETKHNRSPIEKLKFILFLFYTADQLELKSWIYQNKIKINFEKNNLMQSSIQINMLNEYIKEISSRLYFYLLRSFKTDFAEVQKMINKQSMNCKNREYMNLAYKMINQLDYLYQMKDLFHRMFTRYSQISLIQQIFQIVLKESCRLYQKYKYYYNKYFQTFKKEEVEQYFQEICEVIQSNKTIYKKVRQLYFVEDLLTGQNIKIKKIPLVKIGEMPSNITKWLTNIKKDRKRMASSMDLTKSVVMQNKSIPVNIQKLKNNNNNNHCKQQKINFIDQLNEDNSYEDSDLQEDTQY